MPSCSTCNLKIDQTSPVATYENKSYHPDCLKCSHCFRSLSGKQFIKEKNGDLVCEECNIKVSPKCSKCNLHFGPGQTYKRLGNEVFFHNGEWKTSFEKINYRNIQFFNNLILKDLPRMQKVSLNDQINLCLIWSQHFFWPVLVTISVPVTIKIVRNAVKKYR